MFGTIIIDKYKQTEALAMAQFIDDICSPLDSLGWASAGIYCFWDYYTHETLYIGLASDLSIRFKQHNGLHPIDEGACKLKQIQEYFLLREYLGYSILVQSPLAQPLVHRNERLFRKYMELSKDAPIPDYAGKEGLEYIRIAEGQLIESYKLVKGDIPPWNKIGGDIASRRYASISNYVNIIQAFSKVNSNNCFVAKSTIREISENATYEWYETQLHGLRMLMIYLKMSFEDAVAAQMALNPHFSAQWKRIMDDEYLDKQLIV